MSETKQKSNAAAVLWFTGLSGSGKSTVAEQFVEEMEARGLPVEYLDGDRVRDIFPHTGFSREARNEHVRRIGFLAGLLQKHGVYVVCSFISPYRESREFVRKQSGRFIEVYVSTSLEECERRDVKGLYARARRGEISDFTGISDPYEPPEHPELDLDTTDITVDGACKRVWDVLEGVVDEQG